MQILWFWNQNIATPRVRKSPKLGNCGADRLDNLLGSAEGSLIAAPAYFPIVYEFCKEVWQAQGLVHLHATHCLSLLVGFLRVGVCANELERFITYDLQTEMMRLQQPPQLLNSLQRQQNFICYGPRIKKPDVRTQRMRRSGVFFNQRGGKGLGE